MNEPIVLVTGAGGFIGTWVLLELQRLGLRAVGLDIRPARERWQRVLRIDGLQIPFSDVALTDRDGLATLMKRERITHVIHLAALLTPDCQRDPFRGCEINVLGSAAVFDAARLTGQIAAISFASSYGIYGDRPSEHDQESPAPPMFYGAFKLAFDLVAEQYWRHFGLRSMAVRPHVAFGPERESGLTAGPSLACRAAVRGEPYTIGYTGNVGYDYVEDVARAFVRGALECPSGATIVDLPSEPATTEEFVRLIEFHHPAANGKITVAGPAIPSNIPPCPRPIAKVLPDWQVTPLADGIKLTLQYYRDRNDVVSTAGQHFAH